MMSPLVMRRVIIALTLIASTLNLRAPRAQAETAPRQTAAQALVQYLEQEGVTKVYGVPGEETLHIVDALRQSKKIQFVLAANEQGASFMATGYARATGKMGVVLSTLGPGATNLVTGAANAESENTKLLLITGQSPVKRPVGYHQKLPLNDLFAPVTRLSLQPTRASSVVAAARRLVAAANKNPGPVHLALPADVAAREVATNRLPKTAPGARREAPDAAAVQRAAQLIRGARFPVIIAGDGVVQERAGHNARGVLAFAKAHNIPVVPSSIAKGMFPWQNDLVLPPLDAFAKGKGADLVRQADVIITIGYHPTETFDPQSFNPRGKAKIVHISTQKLPASQRIRGMDPQAELTTGLVKGLGAVHRALAAYRAPDTAVTQARALRTQHERELSQFMSAKGTGPLKPQQIMGELRRALDGNGQAMVFGDVGLNKGFLTQWFPVRRAGEVMIPNGLSTMGAALPSAVGAKIARPDLRVVSVSGDGGLLMNVQELATAARNKLPLVHIVLIDKKLGLIENHQRRNALTPAGVDVASLDIKALAKGMGAKGVMVTRATQIAPLVRRALQGNGPTLIGIPVDYSDAQAAADKLGAQKLLERAAKARPAPVRQPVARRR
jgi:acetolactate synthase I/II/III large subunit